MNRAPFTPPKTKRAPFQWPPETDSPDVVSWRNTDHLKYEFCPYNNPANDPIKLLAFEKEGDDIRKNSVIFRRLISFPSLKKTAEK